MADHTAVSAGFRRLVIVDVETTGLDPGNASIWEVAALLVDAEGVRSAFHSRCAPLELFSRHREVIAKVSGLSETEVQGLATAPSPHLVNAALLVWFEAVCGGPEQAVWTSFNVEFDQKFLTASPWQVKKDWWGACVMKLCEARMGFRPRLADAMEQFRLPLLRGHSAFQDARMAASLARALGLSHWLGDLNDTTQK